MKPDVSRLRVAAVFGFLAVALGAFAAHALKGTWEKALGVSEAAYRMDVWRTAEFYHLTHAVALAALAMAGVASRYSWTWRCWVVGTILFSGSLYALCLTGVKVLGAVTPFGGVALLAGWLLLMLRPKADR
jgi:uncharacterized membrane protein YgdD (TMEM256/DUF423 family)